MKAMDKDKIRSAVAAALVRKPRVGKKNVNPDTERFVENGGGLKVIKHADRRI